MLLLGVLAGAGLCASVLAVGLHLAAPANTTVGPPPADLPGVEIGRSVRLSKVVVDREVKLPAGLVVGEDPELDAARFRRTESGVCLITKSMMDRLDT